MYLQDDSRTQITIVGIFSNFATKHEQKVLMAETCIFFLKEYKDYCKHVLLCIDLSSGKLFITF
jgi:hypothetical protein